jgi:hypothetical protein
MFRLKKSTSGQLLNHVWYTSSESAYFWNPKMFTTVRERGYNWGWYLQYYLYFNTGCSTRYRTLHFFNYFTTNGDIATKFDSDTDTFLFISHTTNILLFKFRYNIFIGVRIIKEMPGSVANGTPCIYNIVNINLNCTHVLSLL